jgi:acetolactate synthase-1/2/3 large subunit
MPNHAEEIAKTLAECGVEYIFGLPGGEITVLMDACRRAGLRFLLTGHEASAAFMAQVFGQIQGIPGVCAATLGPGAANLVTGIANAFLDRAPVLALTAQIASANFGTKPHQRLDLNALFRPITKRTATFGGAAPAELVRESIELARSPRPGPVHLVLPTDLATRACPSGASSTRPAVLPEQGRSEVKEIASKITAAKRPLVIVGLGTQPAEAPAVRRFVEKLGAPFMVTPKVKGILPEDDPLFLGVASGMALDAYIVETIRMADLLIGIGFDPVESTEPWFSEIEMVSLDSATMEQGDYHPLEAVGEISGLLSQLAASITEPRPWPDDLREERRRGIARIPKPSGKAVSPLALIEGLQRAFPREGIVACDVGAHKLLLGQFWRSYQPGTFLVSNGLSGMGFGVPAAMAAQLAYPERQVMAIVGDGGMLMMMHNLTLMRALNLPVVIVCLTDGSLSLIRVGEERRGFPPYGVDFPPPDFAAMANAFGIRGETIRDVKDAETSLLRALGGRYPVLLDVQVDLREYYDVLYG